jgi:site-specific DNA recombinase
MSELLREPERLEQEYRQRLLTESEQPSDAAMMDKRRAKLRQGMARLIDCYAEAFIDKDEFEPRIARLQQRLTTLDAQARQIADAVAAQQELRLVIGRLEDFAAQVSSGRDTADWSTRREIIRTLICRVEVHREEVNVVFRVPPNPFVVSPSAGVMQHCGRGKNTALWNSTQRRVERPFFQASSLEQFTDEAKKSSIMDLLG